MAEKVGVPVKYVNQLSQTYWGRKLAVTIFNEHTEQQPSQTYLIRETEGAVRGVLSDRYKIMDLMEIFMAIPGSGVS